MTLTAAELRLLRLSKLASRDVALLSEGASMVADLSMSIADARSKISADRILLAEQFIAMADRMARSRADMSRAAIARYYYAMYHSMRAVAFFHFNGDDFEAHATLHQKGIPKDYPNASAAANSLRDARLLRNEADYDPYPQMDAYFRDAAKRISQTARDFVAKARQYLLNKGNAHL
ncbi:hypothetical protein [Sinomonas sp. ASV322]|uniref:hypothetical protein n=1 Tax=Sinomonas sp. ASV322 TaxID=3041920 RepID=UPI0027DBFAAA|nr:hypothetical protein [Sinomonas sp. ASV322]MDQ4501303.1 hypothetical protein [Sinomonas sp. ASV322]